MAKRTRYPKRTPSRSAVKRAERPAGSATEPVREPARPAVEPIALDAPFESFDDMPLRSGSALTEDEVRRAAQLEAEATAKERAAIAASLRQAARGDEGVRAVARGDLNAPLSVRMSHEYAYVARDVRRIVLTASLMVAILAVLAVLINVLGVIKL